MLRRYLNVPVVSFPNDCHPTLVCDPFHSKYTPFWFERMYVLCWNRLFRDVKAASKSETMPAAVPVTCWIVLS